MPQGGLGVAKIRVGAAKRYAVRWNVLTIIAATDLYDFQSHLRRAGSRH